MYSQNKAQFVELIRAAAVVAVTIAGCLLMLASQAEAKDFTDNPFLMVDIDAGLVMAATDTVPVKPSVMVVPTSKSATLFTLPTSSIPAFGDSRADRLDAYFTKYNMPLAGHGQKFVEVADNCGIDWQLLPAIAVKESSGGKHMRLNNPFGWASAKIGFSSLDEAIERVGEHICGLNPNTARYYKDKTTYQKLYAYNGTVVASYPKEVVWIMTLF